MLYFCVFYRIIIDMYYLWYKIYFSFYFRIKINMYENKLIKNIWI